MVYFTPFSYRIAICSACSLWRKEGSIIGPGNQVGRERLSVLPMDQVWLVFGETPSGDELSGVFGDAESAIA